MHNFSIPKSSETPKGSTEKFFRIVRQKIFDRNSSKPLSFVSINSFRCQNFFCKTELFLQEMFRYCQTKNFRRKAVIGSSSPLFLEFFSIPECFWSTEVFPHEKLRYHEVTRNRQKILPNPSYP